jgi:DUF1680 family protein
VTLNDQPVELSPEVSYVRVARNWRAGDRLTMYSEVPVRVLRPHWRADGVRGSVAVQRGPMVYCIEAEDLDEGAEVEDVVLDGAGPLEPAGEVPKGLEGHVRVAIEAQGRRVVDGARPLYEDEPCAGLNSSPVPLTLVPYFARGNRPSAAMRVWVPELEVGANVPADH